jgi:hypothetical protein
MNKAILIATICIELMLGVLGFISMHLRHQSQRRKLQCLPSWEQLPYRFFNINWYEESGSDAETAVKRHKVRKSRSGLL